MGNTRIDNNLRLGSVKKVNVNNTDPKDLLFTSTDKIVKKIDINSISTVLTWKIGYESHFHLVSITKEQIRQLVYGEITSLTVATTIFNDHKHEVTFELIGGVIYIIDISNNTTLPLHVAYPIQAANNVGEYTEIDKLTLNDYILNSSLIVGRLYKINEVVDGKHSVFLTAITTNELTKYGMGEFKVPDYESYSIWSNYMYGTFSTIVNTFYDDEIVIADNGATAKFIAIGLLQYISGDWSLATSITGSPGTANVSGFISPTYSIGDVVIWGGKHWVNKTGLVGSSTTIWLLDSNYEVENTQMVTNYDIINYDYNNDIITFRKDDKGNEVHFSINDQNLWDENIINLFQWGNNNVYNNIVRTGSIQNINSKGSYYNNIVNGGTIKSNILLDDSIIEMNNLSLDSLVEYNIFMGNAQIYRNTINGGKVSRNTLYGNISNNIIEQISTINNNFIGSGSGVNNNSLFNGVINDNKIGSYSSINFNTLNGYSRIASNKIGNSSRISYNILNTDANIKNNNLGNSSGIALNVIGVKSSIEYNTINNNLEINGIDLGYLSYLNFGTTMTSSVVNCVVSGFRNVSDISTNESIYLQCTKNIIGNESGEGIITYWNSQNIQVIDTI